MNRKSSYTPLRQLINFTINTGGKYKTANKHAMLSFTNSYQRIGCVTLTAYRKI